MRHHGIHLFSFLFFFFILDHFATRIYPLVLCIAQYTYTGTYRYTRTRTVFAYRIISNIEDGNGMLFSSYVTHPFCDMYSIFFYFGFVVAVAVGVFVITFPCDCIRAHLNHFHISFFFSRQIFHISIFLNTFSIQCIS